MPTNADYTREYFQIMDALGGDVAGRRAAYDYMQSSTAIVHHRVVACSFIPRLFNRKTYDTMKETAETAHRILVKVIERYLADPEYRRAFDFDPRLEELILLPRGYDSVLPFARVDTFLDEDDYRVKFCEFNADGSSGMNENREITTSVAQSETFKEFASRHRVEGCELFESWVQAFLDIYATYARRVENPRIAICDYLENGVMDEFHIYADLFRQRGVECVVADVRELSFDGEALHDKDGQRIDAIWRRCVTNDVIDHWDDSQELLNAVRAEKVALIGSFAGAHRTRQADIQGAVRRADPGVPGRRRDLVHRGDRADDGLSGRRLHQRAADPREQGRVDHQAHRPLRRRRRVRWLLRVARGMGGPHRQVRERPRRLPVHRAALHPPLQDRDAAAGHGHRPAGRRRGVRRPEAVQQPERTVPVRRRVPGRVQPPGAAAHDLEDMQGMTAATIWVD